MGGRDDRQDAAAGLARQQQLLPHHDPPCDFDINGGGDHGRRAGHASAHQGPAKNAPLDERFEAILNLVEAAGFDNFDQMATTYYAQTLHAAEQLLAGVYGSSVQWSDWERKGFHEEVLRTMENMLAVEGGTLPGLTWLGTSAPSTRLLILTAPTTTATTKPRSRCCST